MSRKATGAVIEHVGKDGQVYRSLRFTCAGKRRFVSLGPVSEAEAQRALRHTLSDVERGIWQPPQPAKPEPEPEPMPSFHQYAERWWLLNHGRWAPKTREDYRWRLEREGGLLAYFGEMRLDQISVDTVEQFIAAKLNEDDPLSARSINMQLTLLASVLESALERGLIERNAAKGRNRRVRERAPKRTQIDSAEAISALLEASGTQRNRALLATLLFAGLRISEALALRWRDVNIATGWITVESSKTDAGRRQVKLRAALRDELVAIKPPDTNPDRLVFGTSKGRPQNPSNVRNRILRPAAERASALLLERGRAPLPHLTPHSLRRTFASLLYALGEAPPIVMSEMGHTSPQLALAVYAQAMRRDPQESERLRVLVDGEQLADESADRADLADEMLAEWSAEDA